MKHPIFRVRWVTGDTDTCFGNSDLNDLLTETNCRVEDGGKVICNDRNERVGTLLKEEGR